MDISATIEYVKRQQVLVVDNGANHMVSSHLDRVIILLQHGQRFEQATRDKVESAVSKSSNDIASKIETADEELKAVLKKLTDKDSAPIIPIFKFEKADFSPSKAES